MKANFLYIDGQYVHNEKELLTRINELNKKNADATTILLADLYRNGYLKNFLQKWVNKELLINEDSDDWEIAKMVKSLIDKDNKIDLSINVSDYCTINAVKIVRSNGDEIKVSRGESKAANVLRFLLNGYCQNKNNSTSPVDIIISYSVKNEFNAKIGVYVESQKISSIDLSKKCEDKQLRLVVDENLLDPWKNIQITIGQGRRVMSVILEAPRINVLVRFNGKNIQYPMTRIIQDESSGIINIKQKMAASGCIVLDQSVNHIFYIGIWPFEYNSEDSYMSPNDEWRIRGWRKMVYDDNYVIKYWYPKDRKIDFFLIPTFIHKEMSAHEKWAIIQEISIEPFFKMLETDSGRLRIPFVEEWWAASIENCPNRQGSYVIEQKGENKYSLSSAGLEKYIMPNEYGIYAMYGNVSELAYSRDRTPFFMGGDISGDIGRPIMIHEIERVPLFGIRLVMQSVN